MESEVFVDEFYSKWLVQKREEIFLKSQSEKLSTEDTMILCLNHVNIEFKNEFKRIDKRFEQIDQRFDSLKHTLQWGFVLFVTSQIGIWIKLIFS